MTEFELQARRIAERAELVKQLRALVILDEAGSNNPLGRDAAAMLEADVRRIAELEAALKAAETAMTCGKHDAAHYCPTCDNTLYNARAKIRAMIPEGKAE